MALVLRRSLVVVFGDMSVDCVLVESQVGPMALRMKVLQGMIMQHFIENGYPLIREVSSTNKLRGFTEGKKMSYRERKKLGIQVTANILSEEPALQSWQLYFAKHKKKDDLADAFLQGQMVSQRETLTLGNIVDKRLVLRLT